MEIPAASISQFVSTSRGHRVLVEDDVSNVARDLRAIDPGLRLYWSEVTGLFAVVFTDQHGNEQLVFTSPDCDQRIVNRMREIARPDYDLVGELERLDRAARQQAEHDASERMGDAHERLAHAIRQDLRKARPGPVYLPPDVY